MKKAIIYITVICLFCIAFAISQRLPAASNIFHFQSIVHFPDSTKIYDSIRLAKERYYKRLVDTTNPYNRKYAVSPEKSNDVNPFLFFDVHEHNEDVLLSADIKLQKRKIFVQKKANAYDLSKLNLNPLTQILKDTFNIIESKKIAVEIKNVNKEKKVEQSKVELKFLDIATLMQHEIKIETPKQKIGVDTRRNEIIVSKEQIKIKEDFCYKPGLKNPFKIFSLQPDTIEMLVYNPIVRKDSSIQKPIVPKQVEVVKKNPNRIESKDFYPDEKCFKRDTGIFYENLLANIYHNQSKSTYTDSIVYKQSLIKVIQSDYIIKKRKKIHDTSNDWIVAIVLITLGIIAWLRHLYKKYLVSTLKSVFNYRMSVKQFQEKNALTQRVSFALQFIFSINAGLFIFLYLNKYKLGLPNAPKVLLFLLLSGIFFVTFYIKSFVLRFLGTVLLLRKTVNEYIQNISLYNKIIGLGLAPSVICIAYMPKSLGEIFIYIATGLFGFFYFIRFFRGFQIIINKHISIFYSILYLCTVEILPLLLLYKLLNSAN